MDSSVQPTGKRWLRTMRYLSWSMRRSASLLEAHPGNQEDKLWHPESRWRQLNVRMSVSILGFKSDMTLKIKDGFTGTIVFIEYKLLRRP